VTRVLGIDLGGTKLLACAFGAGGELAYRAQFPTGRSFGPGEALALVVQVADAARSTLDGLDAIGIGFPGLVDHDRGVARSTIMLDGWRDVALAERVARATGVACAIDNDANTAALYEAELRGARELLYVAVGTGIGGAVVLGGELWRGRGAAGEIGHVTIDRAGPSCACGRRGCVNLYASGTALATVAIDDAAAALAIAIGSVLNVLDISLVVLGGGVVERGAQYVDTVAARVRRECFEEIGSRCTVEAARGGYDTAAFGAAALARHPRSAAIRPSSSA
jgi:glucokinase